MIQSRSDGTVLSLRVTPRSSRSAIEGIVDGVLRVRLAAPPVDGAANEALSKLLATEFGCSKTNVEIISGARGRSKTVLLRGVDSATVRSRLGLDSSA